MAIQLAIQSISLKKENFNNWANPLQELLSIAPKEEDFPSLTSIKNYVVWLGYAIETRKIVEVLVDPNSGFPFPQNLFELAVERKIKVTAEQTKELSTLVEGAIEKIKNVKKEDIEQLLEYNFPKHKIIEAERKKIQSLSYLLLLQHGSFPEVFDLKVKALQERKSRILGVDINIQAFDQALTVFENCSIFLDYMMPKFYAFESKLFDGDGIPNIRLKNLLRSYSSSTSEALFNYFASIKGCEPDIVAKTFAGPYFFNGTNIKVFNYYEKEIQEIVNKTPESAVLCFHRDETRKDASMSKKTIFTIREFTYVCTKNIFQMLREILPAQYQLITSE